MKEECMVSVIVPVYNLEDYIEECIKSIQIQSYQNLEIIIVDDGSVDNTYEICKKLAKGDDRIRLLQQRNQGVVTARNAGLQIAKGHWVSFVDGDDWIEEEMISHMVRNIGTADLATVGAYQEMDKGEIVKKADEYKAGIYSGHGQMQQIYKKMLYDKEKNSLHSILPWLCNKLFLREKAKRMHEELSKELAFAEDLVFVCRYLLECQGIVITHDSFYHYRYREESAAHKINTTILRDLSNVYNELLPLFEQQDEELELVFQLKKWLMTRVFLAMKDMLCKGEELWIPEFIPNIKGLDEQKIVLYGAGRVGQDFYRHFKEAKLDVVLWVDKKYDACQKKGLPVSTPDELVNVDFDIIYIAIEQEKIAAQIRDTICTMVNVPDKIIWRPPFRLC